MCNLRFIVVYFLKRRVIKVKSREVKRVRGILRKSVRTWLLPGHLFSSGKMAGGRSKISSALNRLALEIPLDLYWEVFTNIIEHTWEWVQLPIINTLCQYRLTFQSVIFKIYSITRNSSTLELKFSFGTNFFQIFLKGQLDIYLNYTIRKESFLFKALYIFKISTYLSSIKCPGFVWEATPVFGSFSVPYGSLTLVTRLKVAVNMADRTCLLADTSYP